MIGETQRRFVGSAGQDVSPRIQAAIVQLAQAYDYARQTKCDLWEFAVEVDTFRAIGLSLDDLRWLVDNGYTKCGREVTKRDDVARKFHPAQNLNFTKNTCFVVTNAALKLTATEPAEFKRRQAA